VRVGFVVAVAGSGATLSACGVGQALNAPITAIGATDVVVQNNLETALQAAQTEYTTSNSFASFGTTDSPNIGETLTVNPSTGPSVISFASSSTGQAVVIAAYNKATQNCYGIVAIAGTATPPILSESTQGTYDFKDPHIVSAGCDAGRYLSQIVPLPTWPTGDPTPSGWPS
jgi:hypothetical protein